MANVLKKQKTFTIAYKRLNKQETGEQSQTCIGHCDGLRRCLQIWSEIQIHNQLLLGQSRWDGWGIKGGV